MGGETSASEQKGVMQWTGTLFRNVACFRFGQGLRVGCPLDTAAVTELLSCFLTLFLLVPLCWYAVSKLLIFCGRFSWSKQTSLSNGFFGYFHDSATELYFRYITPMSMFYSKTKTTKYCLKHEGKSHPCHPWQN